MTNLALNPGPRRPDEDGDKKADKSSFLPSIRAPRLPPLLPRSQYADFLPEIEAVAERDHSPVARMIIVALTALIAFLLIWGSIAEVDKVATATAQVRPFGRVKVINHPDGGIVRVLNVREGSAVREGDVLLELDPTVVEQELSKARQDYLTRAAETARLTAELGDKPLELPPEIAEERPDLVLSQTRLYEERRASLVNKRNGGDEVIRQKRSEVAGLSQQVGKLKESLEVLIEQQEATGSLADKGYFPRLRYLSIKRQVVELEGQIGTTVAQLESARAGLQEATNKRAGLDRDAATETLDKLVIARRDRDVAQRTFDQNRARLDNMVLRSPADGVVQKLLVASPGQSVRPSEPIMNVVPAGDTLVVEAQVTNADIGYIEVGQPATVKVVTYDHIRYGTLEGVVEQISPDAIADEKTKEFTFPVVVRTSKTFLGDAPGQFPVQPGMMAEVDFKIGKRTILSYLTDRVIHTTSNAFKER